MIDLWTVAIGFIVMLVVVGGLLYVFYSRTNSVEKTGYGALIMLAIISAMIPLFWIIDSNNQATAQSTLFKTAVMRGEDLYAKYCVDNCYTIQGGKLINPSYNGYSISTLNSQMSDEQLMNIISSGMYNPQATPQPTNPNTVPRLTDFGGPLDTNDVTYLFDFIRSADSQYLSKNGYPQVNGFSDFVTYVQGTYPSAYATASAPPPVATSIFGPAKDFTKQKNVTIDIVDKLPANAPTGLLCTTGCFGVFNAKVKVGTVITWVNMSKVQHTVTAMPGVNASAPSPAPQIFDSGATSFLSTGAKFPYTVKQTAYTLNPQQHVVLYYCRIHSSYMYAELTIVP